jgi:5'-nucleotidase (lipoprotein e(P4) family)
MIYFYTNYQTPIMKYFVVVFFVSLLACNSSKNNSKTVLPKDVSMNGKLYTAMFQQRAAEYRALCYQAYNIARMRITEKNVHTIKPNAIITDIDETILDNSPYAVNQMYTGNGVDYTPETWYTWTDKASADTMPGAASFLQFVASQNVEVFYITNRADRERTSTLKNLQRFNLPNADSAHLFTKADVSSKEARRKQVMVQYNVLLLMGDNLADLNVLFDKKLESDRASNADLLAKEFGNKFIVFPNCNYGDWEGAFFGKNGLSQKQKDSVYKAKLKGY